MFVTHVSHSKRRARAVTCSSKHHVHHDSGHIDLFPPLRSCPVLASDVVTLCGYSFLGIIERLGDNAVMVSGATKAKARQDEYDEVAEATGKIIVATYGVASVGINIPRIFNLVLIEPGKSFVRVIQSIGRGIRKAEDKDHVQIWDITSTCKFAKRHLTKRKVFYKDANYPYTQEKLEWK